MTRCTSSVDCYHSIMRSKTECTSLRVRTVQIKQNSNVAYTLLSDRNQSNSVNECKLKEDRPNDFDPASTSDAIHCTEHVPHGLIPPVEMDDDEFDTTCKESADLWVDKPPEQKTQTIKAKSTELQKSKLKTLKNSKETFTCETCGKLFDRSDRLTDHRKVHRKKLLYSCDRCEMRFSKPAYLKIHLRRHAGDRAFPCDQCDKRFFDQCDLKVHMRDHTGERPYVCQACGRSFKRIYVLNKHMRTHSKERPFKCDICEKTYKYIYEYRLHIKKHST